ncbi:hypothetical protein DPEC_G00349860 [Dallia pectoralis]|uniref:Uncharacterized protein n=1 Tax=Dallia pectoralis TaxID=75939 RepID=A0ACC2F1E2_DALPE|nr:hypothetical protein DPEC_G00349860 [Dallia pectoralis]
MAVITATASNQFMHESTSTHLITSPYYELTTTLDNSSNKSTVNGPHPYCRETQCLLNLVAGISAAVCFILLNLCILCLIKRRMNSASDNQLIGARTTLCQEETEVIYSTMVSRPEQRDWIRNENDCVYSHIKV